jgi:hypothetical protein
MNKGLLKKISAALSLLFENLQQNVRAFLTMFCLAHHHADLQALVALKSTYDDLQSCKCKYADAEEEDTSFQEVKSRKQKKKEKKKETKARSNRSQNERSKTSQSDDSSVLPLTTTRVHEEKDLGFVL